MAKSKPKTDAKGLTEKQQAYVQARLTGKSKIQSAVIAGSDRDKAYRDFEDSAAVQAALARGFAENQEMARLSREDVINGMLEGVQMAKIVGDPTAVIRGWSEVGKILGYYVPAKSENPISQRGEAFLKRLESLSDAELMHLANGRVIDVEPEREQLPAPRTDDA